MCGFMLIDILTALAVVLSVGILFGVLLALFIHFFGAEEDERVKEIRDALPGINCGSCGFKGCNDYAEALARGEAKPNLCTPGAEAVANKLGEILGVTVDTAEANVAFVHCNGSCEASNDKAVVDGIDSCKARAMTYAGQKQCIYGCLGCGDCASVCTSNAIKIENGIAVVDKNLCVGCGMCASECPKKLITMIPKKARVAVCCASKDKGADARKACDNACIGCKKCERACPLGAITVTDNCARIDYEKCKGCGLCVKECPTGCLIKMNKVVLTV